MNRISTLLLVIILFLSCNGQDSGSIKKQLFEKFDLNSISFTENVNSILRNFGLNLSESKETDYRVLSVIGKESDFKSNFDNHLALATYGYIIKFLAPNNTFFKSFPLASDELRFLFQ